VRVSHRASSTTLYRGRHSGASPHCHGATHVTFFSECALFVDDSPQTYVTAIYGLRSLGGITSLNASLSR